MPRFHWEFLFLLVGVAFSFGRFPEKLALNKDSGECLFCTVIMNVIDLTAERDAISVEKSLGLPHLF